MTLVLELLDDELDLARWLEVQLLGPSLGQLVQELAALHDVELKSDLRCTLDETSIMCVLAEGLTCLSDVEMQTLLRHPGSLLVLADRIRLEGSEYWEDRAVALEVVDAGDGYSSGEELFRLRALEGTRRREPGTDVNVQKWPQTWATALVACAATLLAMFGYQTWAPPQAEAPWVWSDPTLFTQDSDGKAYLGRLASAATSWSEATPVSDVKAVARRIAQFKHGCTLLLKDVRRNDHQALGEADRMWLQARCLETVRVLDAAWDTLDSGGDPIEVNRQMNDEVRRLSEDLRQYSPGPTDVA